MSDGDVTLELLQEIVDAFNAKDVDRIVGYFAEDGEMLLAAGPDRCGTRLKGHIEIRAGLAARMAAVPDIQWRDGEHWISGNTAVSRWRVDGTPVAGGRLDCQGCDLWEFRAGKIVREDTYYKQITG